MAFIHIKEIISEEQRVTLKVDGRLDDSSISTLDDVCKRHIGDGRTVVLNIEGLYHISREGRNFLDGMKDHIIFEKLPSFIKLG